MKEVATQIDIQAAPQKVYEVLSDFARYGEWNPVIGKAKGEARVGASLSLTVKASQTARLTLHTKIETARPGEELAWGGQFEFLGRPVPGVFTGRHSFTIESLGNNQARLHHKESFSGALVPLVWPMLYSLLRPRYAAWNEALKDRCESR